MENSNEPSLCCHTSGDVNGVRRMEDFWRQFPVFFGGHSACQLFESLVSFLLGITKQQTWRAGWWWNGCGVWASLVLSCVGLVTSYPHLRAQETSMEPDNRWQTLVLFSPNMLPFSTSTWIFNDEPTEYKTLPTSSCWSYLIWLTIPTSSPLPGCLTTASFPRTWRIRGFSSVVSK